MTGEGVLSNYNQLLALREERLDVKKNWYDVNGTKIKEIVTNLNGTDHCLILRTKKHRCLAERIGYYCNCYSIRRYGI